MRCPKLKHDFYHLLLHQVPPQEGGYHGITPSGVQHEQHPQGLLQLHPWSITTGTIAASGTLSHESNNFIYLFAPQIHHDLGGKPRGIVGNASNKMGEFSCVYIKLTDLNYFPNIRSTTTMDIRLKHTEVTPLDPEHLKFTKDFKGFTNPLRGTLLPVFFLIYFGQDIPQGSITSDKEKSTLAKLGLGYGLWVETASEAIDKFDKIEIVMDAYSAIDNMTE
jgi:hypothetical protein